MPTATIFRTEGLIPLEAFTMFGVNAKPNTNSPIGFFGTGLKYAIAVLVRLGYRPTLYIGLDKYEFFTKETDFRGKSFAFVRMKKSKATLGERVGEILFNKPTYHELPFTTEYGKKWEAWMAYRELRSNTMDENGETLLDLVPTQGEDGVTLFVVEGEEFAEIHLAQEKIFLPDGIRNRPSDYSTQIQFIDRRSDHIYYRSLRVLDTKKPTLLTYNLISEQDLTEDRTIKYEFMARKDIAEQITKSEDAALIEKVVTASNEFWEHGLDFTAVTTPPSQVFRRVVASRRGAVNHSVGTYYGGYSSSHIAKTPMQIHEPPWTLWIGGDKIVDAENVTVCERPYDYRGNWKKVAQYIVDLVNKANGKEVSSEFAAGKEDTFDEKDQVEEPSVSTSSEDFPMPVSKIKPEAGDEIPF